MSEAEGPSIARLLVVLLLATAMPKATGPQEPEMPLTYVGAIPLPKVQGRIDHMSADVDRQRLFVSCPGNHTVEVIDVDSKRSFRSLREWSEPQGVQYVARGDRVFVADGNGSCVVLDGGLYERLETVKLGDDADNVRLDEKASRVYVGFGSGGITALDAHSGRRLGTATFGGHPEAFVVEPTPLLGAPAPIGTRIFANVPSSGGVVVIDRKKFAIIAQWPVAPLASNYPMAIDPGSHWLFIGCRRPSRLLVLKTDDGSRVKELPLYGDVDDLWIDEARGFLYASCGTGYLQVFAEPRTGVRGYATYRTAPGARTSLWVPKWRKLFVAVPARGRQNAEIRIFQAR